MSLHHAVKTNGPGVHLNRSDIDNLLGLRLSQIKTVLLERHLVDCDQCLDLMLLILEERAESAARRPNRAPGRV